ncbi:MAG: DUF5685 family protein [Eubacteriales bacterium]|nr:DUF5685 family protein [Eubacteriales bacterium]
MKGSVDMFGYIRPVQGELLVKENEFYKAVYCGLCREGGKKISRFTRFFLNNDFVFLCIVRMAVNGETVCASVKRCPYNLKKKCMVCENESLIYTCAAFGILLYYKVLDDVRDSKGIKKLFWKICLCLASRMKKRASRLYPALETEVKTSLDKLYGLESSGCSSPDLVADCFANVTKIVASGNTESEKKAILEECGYHIGRYIYLIDAFEDSREDGKKGNYNVLNRYYSTPEKVLEASDIIKITLEDSIMAFCRAYEKADKNGYDNLVYNTAQLGSKAAFAKTLDKLKNI